jgi:hypothetical protein
MQVQAVQGGRAHTPTYAHILLLLQAVVYRADPQAYRADLTHSRPRPSSPPTSTEPTTLQNLPLKLSSSTRHPAHFKLSSTTSLDAVRRRLIAAGRIAAYCLF